MSTTTIKMDRRMAERLIRQKGTRFKAENGKYYETVENYKGPEDLLKCMKVKEIYYVDRFGHGNYMEIGEKDE